MSAHPNPSPGPAPSTRKPSGAPHVRLAIVSQPRYLAPVRTAVDALAQNVGFDRSAAGHIALAIDEAICNVIRHGYDGRTDGEVAISLWPVEEHGQPAALWIEIEDRAKQVDPSLIAPRNLDDVRPGGLGVHLIRELMDDARYEPRDGGGMRLTMVRRLPSAGSRVKIADRGPDKGGNPPA
ncbi:MAG: ATP-binding protein [Phycisphaerales bacterium]